MMKLFSLAIITLTINIFPQKFTEVFRNELPNAVFEKQSSLNQVEISLEQYGSFNPELVYYYIKFIQAQFDTVARDTFYLKNFFKIKKDYEYKYNTWVLEILNTIQKKDIDDRLKHLSLYYLEDYYDDEIEEIEIPGLVNKTELNYLNFIAAKYLDRNAELSYSPQTDYLSEKIRIINTEKQKFNGLTSDPSSFTPYDYESLMNNLYTFKADSNNSSAKLIAESMIKSVDAYFANTNLYNQVEWFISGSYRKSFMFKDKDTYNTDRYDPSGKKYFYDNPTISIGYSQKLFLTKYQNLINFIRIKGEIGFGFGNKTTDESGFMTRKSNVDGVSNRYEVFGFNTGTFKIKNSQFLSLSVSTPFFYLFDHLSLNIGGGIIISNTNYSVSYDYYYRKFDQEFLGPVILDSKSDRAKDEGFSSVDFEIYPEFSICLDNIKSASYFFSIAMNSASFGVGLKL